jgi:hypothetical protein
MRPSTQLRPIAGSEGMALCGAIAFFRAGDPLSRSRAGTVIFVPRGNNDDPTRSPSELDQTANALLAFGCQALST